LERYRNELLTFNDDIQGTGAIVLATVLSALQVSGSPLADQRFVLFGAGAAGTGVADALRAAMVEVGVQDAVARRRFYFVNRAGLLHDGRTDLKPEQQVYAQPWSEVSSWARADPTRVNLAEAVEGAHPTVLIGLSTVGGAFPEPLIREMARKTRRPVILPLSNPTSKSEATPQNLMDWTDGRALVATGSPFSPVTVGGKSLPVAQCNNVYIFPALGLGAVASRARHVTDSMILTAAKTLAAHSPARTDHNAALLPRVTELRRVAREIAVAVGVEAQRTEEAPPSSLAELQAQVAATQWVPTYPRYVAA